MWLPTFKRDILHPTLLYKKLFFFPEDGSIFL
jgi:hypothetical protein